MPETIKTGEGAPFRTPMRQTELSWRIKELEGHPEIVLREFPIAHPDNKSFETSFAECRRGLAMLEKLRTRYGVGVPTMRSAVGRNEAGERRMLIVLDRLEGEVLDRVPALPASEKDKFDTFLSGLARHYLDTLLKGGDYLQDFRVGQMLYGSKYGDGEKRVWLVDAEPYYGTYESAASSSNAAADNVDIFSRVQSLGYAILVVEKKFSPPVRLDAARAIFAEIMQSIPKDAISADLAREFKN